MKLYKSLVIALIFLTTLAFPWGSELCQGCRIDSSALAGPIYTFPNSQLFQQMISTNGTFLFQDAIDRLPAYSSGIKLEIRTLTKVPLRLAYDLNNYVDFAIGSGGSLTINATGGVIISQNGNVIIRNGNVGIGTTAPGAMLDVAGTVSASALVVNGHLTANALQVNGAVGYKVVNKTTNYTAGEESIILVNASAGNVTINLPAAAGAVGRVYQIKKTDDSGNSVGIFGNSSETIDGATSISTNNQYGGYTMLSDGSNWLLTSYVVGIPRIDFASGGTITEVGGYRIHTFTSSGTFTVNREGNVEYLVVAGGGGGSGYYGGGGGAGGALAGFLNLEKGTSGVNIGNGGAGGVGDSSFGHSGENSSIGSLVVAIGGGGGASGGEIGLNGGSGGGGWPGGDADGVDGSQGYDGGNSYGSANWGVGGGGGAASVGGNGTASLAGTGGDAGHSNITGVIFVYSGGGGGGIRISAVPASGGGYGGTKVGGDGGVLGTAPTAGAVNTGSGGGAGYGPSGNNGAAGGSGIVIIRYPITQ